MMKSILMSGVAVAVMALATVPASAAPVTITQVQQQTQDGEDFLFSFAGLTASDGTGGTITVANGPGGSFPGMDIDEADEFFEVTLDGVNLGVSWGCADGFGGASVTPIPGSSGRIDCQFALALPQTGPELDALLADGAINVGVLFSSEVTFFSEGDEVQVTLDYVAGVSAPTVSAPENTALLGLGLIGLGIARRRRG